MFCNNKDPEFKCIVDKILRTVKDFGSSMSLKIHFLNARIGNFLENLGAISGDKCGLFHQGIKDMKRRYQGR